MATFAQVSLPPLLHFHSPSIITLLLPLSFYHFLITKLTHPSQKSFSATSYATFRPSYPPKLYTQILNYHRGPRTTLLDLGCGHGVISRTLGSTGNFEKIWGTDPSSVMIEEAKTLSNKIDTSNSHNKEANIQWRQAFAEDLSFVDDESLDMVVAGQAAHWFDFSRVWGEIYRKLRKGGTVAFSRYKDNLLVDFPAPQRVLDKYCYGEDEGFMGRFWEQPGRLGLRGGEGKDGKNEKGDVIDEMFEEMLEVEPELRGKEGQNWRDVEVETEWGTVILLARKL
ncbi:hypothetical protein SS1G_13944 [Sclerotinia sclerotiorum 1980 UF-70]|uniref:Methyltransferase type 11 domain-containing protein n=1 Tax=Sclerotinia sclerotiorum (strain ATCC 18683 / 1980 / Ss-1) TaxID=665079 RepID=A7F8L3_SCLS1|nr:hypothetical protein SS1G_13944 [Sclerotinia sclerotiorum 1980 UF-70]EDN99084.1 hypothetical protein SS1G_13944 [Sclerotinia sclerotiorum 1980 UF-70]